MTTFDDLFQNSFDLLLNQFGESVIYSPLSGDDRTITAIVDRSPPEVYSPSGSAITVSCIVRCHDDATNGITSAEIDAGDQIKIPVNKGDTATFRNVKLNLQGDGGGVTMLAVD